MSAYDGLRQLMTDRCSITVRRPLYAQYEDIRNSEIPAGAVLPEGSPTIAVPPPMSTIGTWPALCICAMTII